MFVSRLYERRIFHGFEGLPDIFHWIMTQTLTKTMTRFLAQTLSRIWAKTTLSINLKSVVKPLPKKRKSLQSETALKNSNTFNAL